MKVINKTTKIIGIGDTPVLPGEAIPITDDVAASPMIQHLANIGKIALEPEGAAITPPPTGENTEDGDNGSEKKPLSRMNKAELEDECHRLNIEVSEDDTKDTLAEKIRAATAK